jgi:aspartate carbamoyltransferase catalytic subunit
MKHLLAAADLSVEEIKQILGIAKAFSTSKNIAPLLQGKTVVNIFLEN